MSLKVSDVDCNQSLASKTKQNLTAKLHFPVNAGLKPKQRRRGHKMFSNDFYNIEPFLLNLHRRSQAGANHVVSKYQLCYFNHPMTL